MLWLPTCLAELALVEEMTSNVNEHFRAAVGRACATPQLDSSQAKDVSWELAPISHSLRTGHLRSVPMALFRFVMRICSV